MSSKMQLSISLFFIFTLGIFLPNILWISLITLVLLYNPQRLEVSMMGLASFFIILSGCFEPQFLLTRCVQGILFFILLYLFYKILSQRRLSIMLGMMFIFGFILIVSSFGSVIGSILNHYLITSQCLEMLVITLKQQWWVALLTSIFWGMLQKLKNNDRN